MNVSYATRKMTVPKRSPRILLAEDEDAFRETAAEVLRDAGMHVDTVNDGDSAWNAFRRSPHDAIVSDIRMPGLDGLGLLQKVRDLVPSVPVIMITAYGSMESAVQALRHGARDYLIKPCDLDEVKIRVERVLAAEAQSRRLEALERDSRGAEFPAIIGDSAVMQDIFRLSDKVARSRSTVLITGESGTGKELVAREIHRLSGLDRFVPVNCGAIPENLLESELFGHRKGSFTGAVAHKDGLFRVADGGTLFLDEIGELPMPLQVKMLRCLDTGEIQPVGATTPIKCEPRIIAATNRDLEQSVKEGRFREDLFYRLNVFQIALPALRERVQDIPALAAHFLQKYAARSGKDLTGLRPEALRALTAANWRGNVRELENVIERAVILADAEELGLGDLPATFQDPGTEMGDPESLTTATARFEREHIVRVVQRCGGDKRAAAKVLGIGLSSLYRKI